jgi:class 3 adenylate cyclase/ketosteroid isomerase-like protein
MSAPQALQRSEELRAVATRQWAAFRRGDLERFFATYSSAPGLTVIGTDESEFVEDRGRFVDYIRTQFALVGSAPFGDGIVDAWAEGDVGWAVVRSTVSTDGVERALRVTSLFRLEVEGWRIVHEHWSVGIPNQEVIGVPLAYGLDRVVDVVESERPDLTGLAATDGTITLVFTDIEGSTALNGSYGDEAWIKVLRAHNAVIERQTDAHGGTVVQRVGDGYMLVFPAARRALRAALAIQGEIRGTFDDPGSPIRVRMGVHTGEVIRDANEFFGQAVNYAARVAAAGGGGEILASNLVHDLVSADRSFTFGAPREVEMKGIDGRQIVHPLDQPLASSPPRDPLAARLLAGRGAEPEEPRPGHVPASLRSGRLGWRP